MEHLSRQQQSICENAGLFGALIAGACLIQHLVFMLPHWITFTIAGVYVFIVVAFILLALKKAIAPPLLAVSIGLVLLLEVLLTLSLAFSLILLVLLVYVIIITAVLFGGDTARQLKKHAAYLKEEAAKWNDII